MKLSDAGLDRIKGYEGYGKKLPDGSCKAYQDVYHGKLDKPTIGWGCTEGVTMGMVWSREEAEAALRKEIAKHEAAVSMLVKVPVNQNEVDSMIALSYNIGTGIGAKEGGFANSTVLRKLNKEDRMGAARAFHLFNKAGGGIVPGLVQRRASESALFLKPVAPPEDPAMPQTVTASKEPPSRTTVAVATTAVVSAAPAVLPALPSLPVPSVPVEVTTSLTNLDAWKTIGEHLWTLKDFAASHPTQSLVVAVPLLALWLWPKPKAAP